MLGAVLSDDALPWGSKARMLIVGGSAFKRCHPKEKQGKRAVDDSAPGQGPHYGKQDGIAVKGKCLGSYHPILLNIPPSTRELGSSAHFSFAFCLLGRHRYI